LSHLNWYKSGPAFHYLIANKQIATRRIGSRVLIAVTELQRFSRRDHPESVAS
jgi:hypothetical protein